MRFRVSYCGTSRMRSSSHGKVGSTTSSERKPSWASYRAKVLSRVFLCVWALTYFCHSAVKSPGSAGEYVSPAGWWKVSTQAAGFPGDLSDSTPADGLEAGVCGNSCPGGKADQSVTRVSGLNFGVAFPSEFRGGTLGDKRCHVPHHKARNVHPLILQRKLAQELSQAHLRHRWFEAADETITRTKQHSYLYRLQFNINFDRRNKRARGPKQAQSVITALWHDWRHICVVLLSFMF